MERKQLKQDDSAGSKRQSQRKLPKKSSGDGHVSSDRLKAKEDEYRRLNAELEAKTSELVREAEQLLEGNLSILSDLEEGEDGTVVEETVANEMKPTSHTHSLAESRDQNINKQRTKPQKRPATSQVTLDVKPHSSLHKKIRPITSYHGAAKSHGKSHDQFEEAGIDRELLVAMEHLGMNRSDGEEDEGGRDEFKGQRDGFRGHKDYDDIMPNSVDDMGSEATIRFLKAKLRVMQEEIDCMCEETGSKDKLIASSQLKIKELDAEVGKLKNGVQNATRQVNRHKQSAEEFKMKSEGLEGQLITLRKEIDTLKGSQKKTLGQRSALEVRMNRALEEAEKYRSALQKAKLDTKESSKFERQKMERLSAENRQLEKQKSELIAAFKKQMKLIDVIKRQKMHIESAKMLSFTEEEFMKALDWGSN